MKTVIKRHKNCKNIVEVKLSPEKVKEEFNKVYEGIQKLASIPGFRVGKVPRDLLEIHYGKNAREEVIKRLIPETFSKVLEEYKLDPVGYPDISDVSLDFKDGFSYKASIETRPSFSLKGYKGLKLKKKKVDLSEDDVQKNLESLRKLNAQKVPKENSEEKEEVLPKLDDDFAKDLGFENLETLKDAIREDLERQAERDAQTNLEMQIVNQIVGGVSFEIPESLVNAEKKRLLKDADMRLAYIDALQKKEDPGGKKFTLSDKDKKELEENAEKQAVRNVRTFFILDKIAQLEKIYLKEEEIERRIEEMAAQYKKTKDEFKAYIEKNNMLDELVINMRNRKVMLFLLKEAKVV